MAKCITLKRAQEIALDAYHEALDKYFSPCFCRHLFRFFLYPDTVLWHLDSGFTKTCGEAYTELAYLMTAMPPKRTKKRIAYDALAKYLRLHKGE